MTNEADHIARVLADHAFEELDADVESYEAGSVLTNNAGFTLARPDGSEYQITVVQSRLARTNGTRP